MVAALAEPTDAAELLARIAEGDEAALSQFYRTYHARVYAFVLRRLSDPAEAAEILNEVMLEIWRKAGRFEGRSQALTWVLGIANNKALDALRRRGRREVEELDESLPDEDAAPAAELLAAAQNAEFVRRCMEKLSDTHRLMVHLAFFEDLPYPDIARVANCPVGTVKTRVFHAKRLLKECLSLQVTHGAR